MLVVKAGSLGQKIDNWYQSAYNIGYIYTYVIKCIQYSTLWLVYNMAYTLHFNTQGCP